MQLPSPLGQSPVLPIPAQTIQGPIGYAQNIGQGAIAVQNTDKSTTVTLNKLTGDISVNAAALAAGATVTFVVLCNLAANGMLAIVQHYTGGTLGSYTVCGSRCGAGSYSVTIRNNTAGALSEGLNLAVVLVNAPTT